MESLYTKYRPQTFADVVGQGHVVSTLERAVMEGRTSHAYLFCGPRGTGKTTMARLLAKALMCEQGQGHLPDGTCEQCRLIAAGEHPDVYELDAASRTGVDNVRDEIISRVSFAPVRASYKMYIIDEVHMLTTAAFNALLKTLEEPPAHVVFVLCTTDPQKIPETILSRVQRFDFHAISNADIQARLAHICEREGFGYDPDALALVVRHARGGMRDAISELEQLSVSGGGTISVDVARDVLGEISASTLEKMSLAMAERDIPSLFAQVEQLVEVGRDLLQFSRALAARLRDVYVVAAIGMTAGTFAPDDDLPAISKEAQAFGSVDRISRALELLGDASAEMRVSPNQRLVLEVALTKIARPQTEMTMEALADRISILEGQVAALSMPGARVRTEAVGKQPAGAGEGPVTQAGKETVRADAAAPAVGQAPAAPKAVADGAAVAGQSPAGPASQQAAAAGPQPAAPVPGDALQAKQGVATVGAGPSSTQQAAASGRPASAAVAQAGPSGASQSGAPATAQAPAAPSAAQAQPARAAAQPQSASPEAARPQAAPTSAAPAVTDPGELQRRWRQVVDTLLSAHPQHGSLLMSSTATADDGETLKVALPARSSFALRMLERADVRANVDPVIASVFGPRGVRFSEDGSEGASAAPVAAPAAAPTPQPAQSNPQATAMPKPQAPVAPQPSLQAQQAQAPMQRSAQAQAPAAAPQAQAPAAQTTPGQAPVAAQAAPASSSQASQQSQAAPAQAQSQAPAPSPQAATQQAASGYKAPWEPSPDDVPYDDADFSPYAEEYMYGDAPEPPAAPMAQQAAPAPTPIPQPPAAPAQPAAASTTAPTPQPPAAPAPAPATAPQPPAAPAQPAAAPTTAPTPQPPAAPAQPAVTPAQAPTPQPSPAPAPATPQPAAAPTPQPPAASQPDAATSDPDAKPTGARRPASVPKDIVAMMTKVFGEGVTYTEEPPEGESAAGGEDEASASVAGTD